MLRASDLRNLLAALLIGIGGGIGGGLVVAQPALAQERDEGAVEALQHDEALTALGQFLGESVAAIQSDPSIPQILEGLERGIAATRRIREAIDADGVPSDEQLRDIARGMGEIAAGFRAISDLAPQVFERRVGQLGNIEAIGAEVDFLLADARAQMQALRTDNQRIQEQLRSETLSHAEIEKLRMTRQANNAEIHSLEAAVAAWNAFAERHGELVPRLTAQSEMLDLFFHALRENARVYEAAARTLNLANSLREALNDLEGLQDLESMIAELMRSWSDVMRIVDEVSSGVVSTPGM